MPDSFRDYIPVFNIDYNKIIFEILKNRDVQKEIIEFNQKDQLSEGVDSEGQRIISISADEQGLGNVYSVFTIAERQSKGLQTINVDLKDTGQFWSTFYVVVKKDSFEIKADFNSPGEDIRTNFNDKYEFLGLTEDSLSNFVWSVLFDRFSKEVLRQLEENASKL